VILRDEVESAASPVLEPAPAERQGIPVGALEQPRVTFLYQQDAPSCHECGSIMVRNGSCYKCLNCGSTSGCS